MCTKQMNKYIHVISKKSESLLKGNLNNVSLKFQPRRSMAVLSKYGKSKILRCGTESIWADLAIFTGKHKPKVNLGESVADFDAPKFALDALKEALETCSGPSHQYARVYGHTRLVKAISIFYGRLLNRDIHATTEVLVTIGSFQGIFSTIMGHVRQGDEVIMIEPCFDLFQNVVCLAGGVIKSVALRPPKTSSDTLKSSSWVFDGEELAKHFSEKTRMLILSNPHSPIGKCYSQKELSIIASLCVKYNVMCLCDEEYEWVVFPKSGHIRIASLPDMWQRTVTVGSAGKTFDVTGWRLGWVYGPSILMKNVYNVHLNSVHSCCTFLQEALAIMFEHENRLFGKEGSKLLERQKILLDKRDHLMNVFAKHAFIPVKSDATFFFLLDFTKLLSKAKEMDNERDKYPDMRFIKYFVKKCGILLIPISPFYREENKEFAKHYVRVCFLRSDETLKKAENLLESCFKG